jgi:hypothetical protein
MKVALFIAYLVRNSTRNLLAGFYHSAGRWRISWDKETIDYMIVPHREGDFRIQRIAKSALEEQRPKTLGPLAL